jgi:hypothetical protein
MKLFLLFALKSGESNEGQDTGRMKKRVCKLGKYLTGITQNATLMNV